MGSEAQVLIHYHVTGWPWKTPPRASFFSTGKSKGLREPWELLGALITLSAPLPRHCRTLALRTSRSQTPFPSPTALAPQREDLAAFPDWKWSDLRPALQGCGARSEAGALSAPTLQKARIPQAVSFNVWSHPRPAGRSRLPRTCSTGLSNSVLGVDWLWLEVPLFRFRPPNPPPPPPPTVTGPSIVTEVALWTRPRFRKSIIVLWTDRSPRVWRQWRGLRGWDRPGSRSWWVRTEDRHFVASRSVQGLGPPGLYRAPRVRGEWFYHPSRAGKPAAHEWLL